jgi:hypothetical protein
VEDLTEKYNDKITNLKSRGAVYIKNKNCVKAVDDCTATIEISPNDPKELNRLLKLWTRLNRYSDAKAVYNYDPKNQGYQPFLLHMHAKINS